MGRGFLVFAFVILSWVASGVVGAEESGPWVLIDTRSHTLTVFKQGKVLERLDYVAFGRGGAGFKEKRGDGKTPLGEFRIAWVNNNSRFHRFYGLDYPNLQYIDRAFLDGRLDQDGYRDMLDAIFAKKIPPQDTWMGGQIGLHGLGEGSMQVHRKYNWTQGCVAVTNQEIDRLGRWLAIGTKVVIR